MQLGGIKCIETIVDESAGTAALWTEVKNSGNFRAAQRLSFNADNKITAYHGVFDTYNVLGSGGELALSQAPPAPLFWASWGLLALGVAAMVSALLVKRSRPKEYA